jgi:phospholipid transport system substrate-binding protein
MSRDHVFRLLRAGCRVLAAGMMSTGFAAVPTTTDQGEPVARLHLAIDEVLATAYPTPGGKADPERVKQLRPVLEKYFDSDRLTRLAIGPGWRTFTPEQQRQAVELFPELVFRTYAGKLGSGTQPVIGYQPAVILAPNRQEVPTTITQDAAVVAVAFRFERTGAEWRIYDVIIEGISLVGNYRTQLDAIFQKSGAAGVLHALEKKLADRPAPEGK